MNIAPVLALIEVGSQGSALGPNKIIPDPPTASRVRSIVPIFPGLPDEASATQSELFSGIISSKVVQFCLTIAAMP